MKNLNKINKGSYVYAAILGQKTKVFSIDDISETINKEYEVKIDTKYVGTYINRMLDLGIVNEDIKGYVFNRA